MKIGFNSQFHPNYVPSKSCRSCEDQFNPIATSQNPQNHCIEGIEASCKGFVWFLLKGTACLLPSKFKPSAILVVVKDQGEKMVKIVLKDFQPHFLKPIVDYIYSG